MSKHEHSHDHDHSHHHHSTSNITVAFWLNLAFTIFEIVGGILTNSIAVLSDAVHDLGDSISLLFSLIMEKISKRSKDERLTFGYKRYSILGAFFSALVLIVGSTFIIYNAVNRIFTVEEVNAKGMLIMSLFGIAFNGLAVFRLRKDETLNAKVVYMHLMEDVLGWVSILVVSIIMIFIDLPILDPILSIVIAVFVLSRIIPTFMKIGRIFLQYKPDGFEITEIKQTIESLDEIEEVHDIHLWSLDGTQHIFSCHLVVRDEFNCDAAYTLKKSVRHILIEMGIEHSTLELETPKEAENCKPC